MLASWAGRLLVGYGYPEAKLPSGRLGDGLARVAVYMEIQHNVLVTSGERNGNTEE
jgi:hypothetical protein